MRRRSSHTTADWAESALQVWQAVSEAQGRGRGDRELAIVFTDLVEFLGLGATAGDDLTLELLRDVSEAM